MLLLCTLYVLEHVPQPKMQNSDKKDAKLDHEPDTQPTAFSTFSSFSTSPPFAPSEAHAVPAEGLERMNEPKQPPGVPGANLLPQVRAFRRQEPKQD